MIEPVRATVTVAVDPATAFTVFTDRIAEWWPLDTHALTAATGVAFADGRLVETGPEGEREWGEVRAWEPPHRLAFSWHLGRPQATEVEVTFTAVDGGTEVVLEHRGWEAWGEDAAERRASYDSGWDAVLGAYAEAT